MLFCPLGQYAGDMIWVILACVLVAVWIVCGIAHGASMGLVRKKNPAGGAWLAMRYGPFAELVVDKVRDKHRYCPFCREAISNAAEICPHCDEWLNGRPQVIDAREIPFMETFTVERDREIEDNA